jgi:hypothetical protein
MAISEEVLQVLSCLVTSLSFYLLDGEGFGFID